MTREKKELLKKLDYLTSMHEADMSFGYWDDSLEKSWEDQMKPYEDRLAKLMHADSYTDAIMYEGTLYQKALQKAGIIPFA